jgi:uncharacterized membrane protein
MTIAATDAKQQPDVADAGARPFRAVLFPNRSLGPRGFLALMAVLIGVSFTAGMVFVAMGAWPVFGFFGLDVAAVYVAFRLNYRSGRLHEIVALDGDGLAIERVHPGGRRESWRFEPYWLKVEIEGDEETGATLTVASHGRSVVLGDFLSHREKIEFAAALARALAPYKSA